MKRMTTGMVALGAATALMIGGGGSIAYWQNSLTMPGVQFTTGDLSLQNIRETWTVNSHTYPDDGDGSSRDHLLSANPKLVPGSTVTWEQVLVLEQNGHEMYLEIDVNMGGITAHAAGHPETPVPAVTDEITVTYRPPTALHDGGPVFEHVSGNIYRVAGQGQFSIATELAWAFGATADSTRDTQERTLNLAGSTFTVRQVAAPAPV